MADDKKNIPNAGKADEPPKSGKVEPVTADSPVHDQSAPAKAEASKDKDAPAPSMEGAPQPGKDEKQTTIPGMGDPAPAGKMVDLTAVRDGATKGKFPEKAAAQDKDKQAGKAKDAAKLRRGRPPKADKAPPRQGQAATSEQNVPKQTACRERRSRQSGDPGCNRAAAQQEMRQAVAVKTNIDYLLGVTDGRKNKEQER